MADQTVDLEALLRSKRADAQRVTDVRRSAVAHRGWEATPGTASLSVAVLDAILAALERAERVETAADKFAYDVDFPVVWARRKAAALAPAPEGSNE